MRDFIGESKALIVPQVLILPGEYLQAKLKPLQTVTTFPKSQSFPAHLIRVQSQRPLSLLDWNL